MKPDRARYKSAAVLLLVTAAAMPSAANAAGYRQGACGDFTVAMIPDTQGYVDYRHQKASGFPYDGAEQLYDQMRWIGEHAQSAGGDIAFATHMGDVWMHYSKWMDPAHAARGFKWMPNVGGSEVAASPKPQTETFEIPVAIQAYQLIQGKLPFSVLAGNHDFDALWTDPAHPPRPEAKDPGRRHLGGLTGFQLAFSDQSEFFKDKAWYVGSHDGGADSAQIFTAGRCRFLHIGLQYQAPDESLEWAARMIARFPGIPTIVSTHDYINRQGEYDRASNPNNSLLDPRDNDPQMMWDEFISRYDQIFLVLCGHIGGQGFSIATNRAGNKVWQMMADYQGRGQVAKDAGRTEGTDVGDGWLRLLKFRLDGPAPTMEVRTFSTHFRKFASEMPDYGKWYKAHDGQAKLSDTDYLAREEFTVPLTDFHSRFGAPGR